MGISIFAFTTTISKVASTTLVLAALTCRKLICKDKLALIIPETEKAKMVELREY